MTTNPITNRHFNIDAGLLSSVMLFGAVRISHAGDDAPAATVTLTGTARDFLERTDPAGHPDFEKQPDHGFGLYCGNVDLFLGDDGKPVFTGNGNKITDQWTDADGHPIARHLFNKRFSDGSGAPPTSCDLLEDAQGKEAYEVCLVSAVFNDDGTSTWTYHVRETGGGKDLSHWNLKLDPAHVVMPGTTAGYDHGIDGSTGYYGIKWDVTDGFEEGEFTIVLDGHWQGVLDSEGVLAKGGKMHDTGEMYIPSGTESTDAGPNAGGPGLVDDPALGDQEGTSSYSDTGAIESADSFDSWFRDQPGINLSKPLGLEFHRQDDGLYVFDDTLDPLYSELGGFFPLEGQGFGNPGGHPNRNFHFTFEMEAEFTYDADAEQVFRFIGDDDVWVFVDGKLAVDLGGVHSAERQTVDMDRMGLTDGETYKLKFFFAERHRTQSNFRIETNLELATKKLPMMTAAFD